MANPFSELDFPSARGREEPLGYCRRELRLQMGILFLRRYGVNSHTEITARIAATCTNLCLGVGSTRRLLRIAFRNNHATSLSVNTRRRALSYGRSVMGLPYFASPAVAYLRCARVPLQKNARSRQQQSGSTSRTGRCRAAPICANSPWNKTGRFGTFGTKPGVLGPLSSRLQASGYTSLLERAMGFRTHVRSLGSLSQSEKDARIGGNFAFFDFLKWIPIGAA
jgi:hypothetical protein